MFPMGIHNTCIQVGETWIFCQKYTGTKIWLNPALFWCVIFLNWYICIHIKHQQLFLIWLITLLYFLLYCYTTFTFYSSLELCSCKLNHRHNMTIYPAPTYTQLSIRRYIKPRWADTAETSRCICTVASFTVLQFRAFINICKGKASLKVSNTNNLKYKRTLYQQDLTYFICVTK